MPTAARIPATVERAWCRLSHPAGGHRSVSQVARAAPMPVAPSCDDQPPRFPRRHPGRDHLLRCRRKRQHAISRQDPDRTVGRAAVADRCVPAALRTRLQPQRRDVGWHHFALFRRICRQEAVGRAYGRHRSRHRARWRRALAFWRSVAGEDRNLLGASHSPWWIWTDGPASDYRTTCRSTDQGSCIRSVSIGWAALRPEATV